MHYPPSVAHLVTPRLVNDLPAAGPACAQSRLSPPMRLLITFGVLFGLKWAMPTIGVSPLLQVLTLLVVATYFAWLFWWNCSPHRRGPLLLIGSLWVAGIAKILLMR